MLGFLTVPLLQTLWSPDASLTRTSVCVPQFPLWPRAVQDPSQSSVPLLCWPQLGPMGKDPGGGAGQKAKSSGWLGGGREPGVQEAPLPLMALPRPLGSH